MSDCSPSVDGTPRACDLTKVGSLIRSSLSRLRIDPLGGDLSWEEWVNCAEGMDETSITQEERHQGVQVLDAMTARGRTVRALFVLGMNEKVFPRYVREDPFLRDRQRVVLESTLGYKIDEKLAGHEEESLLFELLSRSATNRLYLSYQRADDSGRVMAPSGFVAMAMSRPTRRREPEEDFPSTADPEDHEQPSIQTCYRSRIWPWGPVAGPRRGTPTGCDGARPALVEQGLATLKTIERESPELGPFDGMFGARPFLPTAMERSFSPTALERYQPVPFSISQKKWLSLAPLRRLHHDHLPPLTLGTLVQNRFV